MLVQRLIENVSNAPQGSRKRRARSASLDILRFVAVVLVLGRHMETYPLDLGKGVTFYVTRLWQNGGWTGVDLFFVLSGFLIGGLLFAEVKKTNGLRVGRFLIRRGLKIYPAFYVLLVATITFDVVAHVPMRGTSVVAEVFFLQNYLGGMWNHTWSLAVEEHFYIALPLLIILLLSVRRLSLVPWIALAAAVTCLSLRIYLARTLPFDGSVHLFPTHLRIDSLLVGVCTAYAYHFHRSGLVGWSNRWRWPLAIGGAALFLPAFYCVLGGHWWLHSVALTGFAVGAAAILIALVEHEPPDWLIVRWAAFLGSRSYSIYLWHSAVGLAAARLWLRQGAAAGALAWYVYFIGYMLGSFGVGLLMATIVEFPVLALRNRFAPATVGPLPAVAATVLQDAIPSGQPT